MVLRNVKERNKQCLSLSCFLRKQPMGTILADWCLSNLDKILEKTCEGVYFFGEAADQKSTALLKIMPFTVTFEKHCLKFGRFLTV